MAIPLHGKTVAVAFGHKFEVKEIFLPIEMFEEVGARVVLVAPAEIEKDRIVFEPDRVWEDEVANEITVDLIEQSTAHWKGREAPVEFMFSGAAVAKAAEFDAILCVGGHAPVMYKEDVGLQQLLSSLYTEGKIIGAICHGSLMLTTASKGATSSSVIADGLPMTGFNHVLRMCHIKGAILRSALTGDRIDVAPSEEGVKWADFEFPGGVAISSIAEDPYYQQHDIQCLIRCRNIITGRHYFDMKPLAWEMIKAIQESSGLVEQFTSIRIPGINNSLRSDIVESALISALQQLGIPRSAIRDIKLIQQLDSPRRVFSSFKKTNIIPQGAENIAHEAIIELFAGECIDVKLASRLESRLRDPEVAVDVFDLGTKTTLHIGAGTLFAP